MWPVHLVTLCILVCTRQLKSSQVLEQMLNNSKIRKGDHANMKRKFICLVYFKQFSKHVKSNLTEVLWPVNSTMKDKEVFPELEMPIKATNIQENFQFLTDRPKEISWNVGILQAGNKASYTISDVIIDPILENFRNWATEW